MRWNYHKLQQLSLLQSATDSSYKLRQRFCYKVRYGLLQIVTGITKCDDYCKLRQYKDQFVTENPKGGITENFGRIQRGDHSNLLGNEDMAGEGGGGRESHEMLLGESLQ